MLNTLNSFEDLSDKSKSVVKSILDIINDFDKNNELEVFLFGSYAKGKVRVDSDIDLLILTHQTGLSKIFGYRFKDVLCRRFLCIQ
ncbi:MAG: nucleotidyltransferase domain-containing protein [Niameybacter sp.]|uniref:nucleotidyltransferase domain-containing protein n=1 Tax=Niameybacter sp. TaxID=2033640 RepID=UPI002FCC677D